MEKFTKPFFFVAGAKGVVLEVLSDDLVVVFLSALSDMVTLPPDHLKPAQPKVKEKIKILKGEYKGKTGVLLGLQSSKGIVRLTDNPKDVKMLDLAWMARCL
jgi:transcription elongation factor SPT5